MTRRDPGLDPELAAFLEPGKIDRRAPPDVRARALARARAIVAAGDAMSLAPRQPDHAPPVPPPVLLGHHRGLVRLAAAAAVALTVGAVGAFAALGDRTAPTPQVASQERPLPAPPVRDDGSRAPSIESPTVAPSHAVTARPARATRVGGEAGRFDAELDLVQRAHGAYTRRDFSGALILVAEHARRFPRGHLAEQREALRVRSLLGAGRSDEAHRAAAAFAVRFPRSVLLPRVAAE